MPDTYPATWTTEQRRTYLREQLLALAAYGNDGDHDVRAAAVRAELAELDQAAPAATEPGCLHPECVLEHPHAGPAILAAPAPRPRKGRRP